MMLANLRVITDIAKIKKKSSTFVYSLVGPCHVESSYISLYLLDIEVLSYSDSTS